MLNMMAFMISDEITENVEGTRLNPDMTEYT